MKQEAKIIENLAISEKWFNRTFENLKKTLGPLLNSVDFKNYFKLAYVFLSQGKYNEIDRLVRGEAKDVYLVGAAKNLLKSLNGVKWIFNMLDFLALEKRDLEMALDIMH